MQIEVWSDTVCPWCYIGLKRLQKALAQRPGLQEGLPWLPFELNADLPEHGVDRREYLECKFGSPEPFAASGRQTEVADAILRAYFTAGRGIGAVETLTEIGIAAGLDARLVATVLANDELRNAIVRQEAGAQDVAVFLQTLDRLPAPAATTGPAC